MCSRVVLLIVCAVLGGCAVDSDPRGQWGYFENARSLGQGGVR